MKNLIKAWERLYPSALGVMASVLASQLPRAVQADVADKLANPILSILAIAVGFIAAALTILLTAPDIKSINRFKSVPDLYNRFVDYHWEAISTGMASATLSLVVIIASKKLETWPQVALFYAWLLFTVWAFAAFFRVVHLLRGLLRL